jgi:hypothetical protein
MIAGRGGRGTHRAGEPRARRVPGAAYAPLKPGVPFPASRAHGFLAPRPVQFSALQHPRSLAFPQSLAEYLSCGPYHQPNLCTLRQK